MAWQSYLAIVTFLTLPNARAQSAKAPPEDVVVLVSIEGKAELAPASTDNWMPATNNQVLHLGDRLRTDKSSRAIIRFSKWGQLRVREASLFTIEPPREPGRRPLLNLLKGFFYFFNRDKAIELDLQNRLASAATRGTEFQVAVAEDGRMEVSVLEGEVELRNSLGPVTLSSGQQGVALPGQHPTRTAVIAALNVIQWCLYYPAVLDVDELGLSEAERSALRESLAAWRSGDLVKALQSYPQNRQPVSERERVYRAALLLVVGEIAQAESLLPSVDTPFSNALRELIAAVQFQTYHRAAPPVLATEWLAESYYRQSRAGVDKRMLEDALKAAEAAVDVAPNSGLAWERLAELEFSFGRTGKTLVALDNAIRLSPRNAQALALKGFLLSAQNKIPQALEYFDQAIAADGALANAWLGRGLCRIRQGNAAAGREDLLVAAALEPQRAVLRSYLGKAFSDAGDDPRTRKELELARTLDPKDPTSWLYSALDHEQHNRINEAIRDLEQSKELNDNRSLYRSDLLLDQDRAVRSANLARVYQEAGMEDVALREASRAVSYDYGNYSAHLFLANSYNALRDPNFINLRFETPSEAEYLLANLLSPVGAGTLSPALSQQEYSKLFDRDGLGLASSTEYLSRGSWTESGAQFGVLGHSSYSLEAFYRADRGQRTNDDVEQRILSLSFKEQLTLDDSLFFQVTQYRASGGDLQQYYDPNTASPDFRFRETQEPTINLGYHHAWDSDSHTLFLASYVAAHLSLTNSSEPTYLIAHPDGMWVLAEPISMHEDLRIDPTIYSAELQQILQRAGWTTIAGARFQYGTFNVRNFQDHPPSDFALLFDPAGAAAQDFSSLFRRWSFYGYEMWRPADPLQIIGGVSYDRITFPANFRNAPLSADEVTLDQLSPKAGLIWTPSKDTTLRFAYTRSVTGPSLDQSIQLEPSQVAGFVQSYRSLIPESIVGAQAGPRFDSFGLSLEQRFPTGTYIALRGEILYSSLQRAMGAFDAFPLSSPWAAPTQIDQHLNYRERSLLAICNQLVGKELSFGAQYRLTQAQLDTDFVQVPDGIPDSTLQPRQHLESVLHQVSLDAVFNHRSGFFAQAQALWNLQSNQGALSSEAGNDFWQFNIFAGYRFARRQAEATVGLLNLFDQDYKLSPLTVYNELPRQRTLLVRFSFNF
jgi:tetratricopeptide (TPR) repeat protein